MTTGLAPQARRLRVLIIADTTLAAAGAVFAVAVAVFIIESTTLALLGGFVALIAVAMGAALVPLGRGDIDVAVAWLAAANWTVSIVNATVATFSWPLMMSSALLPAAVAVSFVHRKKLVAYIAISIGTATLVASLGLLQDVTGLSDEVPDSLETIVLLVFAPLLAALITLSAFENSFRLQSALDEALLAHVALADRARELQRSRARLVAATDRERRRIERDLHDGAQSRLIAINLQLARARRLVEVAPAEADTVLVSVRNELQRAQNELRDLAHGVYPTVLTQHGLVPAIQAVADHSPIPTHFDSDGLARYSPDVEAAVYFCILEATQNACKHARASNMTIRLRDARSWLRFEVVDDGVGLAADHRPGYGIDNMGDRVESIGGWVVVEPARPHGTRVSGQVDFGDERPTVS